jgi:hypothetical protein
MGKQFIALLADGSERFAADLSTGRAALFYDIALLLEGYVGHPCGISPDAGQDEHRINPAVFLPFFERVWKEGWLAEQESGFVAGWAGVAAGMIENITLAKRNWVDRNGTPLVVQRYLRPDE